MGSSQPPFTPSGRPCLWHPNSHPTYKPHTHLHPPNLTQLGVPPSRLPTPQLQPPWGPRVPTWESRFGPHCCLDTVSRQAAEKGVGGQGAPCRGQSASTWLCKQGHPPVQHHAGGIQTPHAPAFSPTPSPTQERNAADALLEPTAEDSVSRDYRMIMPPGSLVSSPFYTWEG